MGNFIDLFSQILGLIDGINLIKIFNYDLSLLDLTVGSIVLYVVCIVIYYGVIKKG